jgi:NAD+ synthetase
MRIALAQINTTVGDLEGNAALVMWYLDRAREAGAELVVFPELTLCGYPPRDLLHQEGFIEACQEQVRIVGRDGSHGVTVVFGTPLLSDPERPELGNSNSLVVWRNGKYIERYDKRLLPNYDVFDEDRYFRPGRRATVIRVNGVRVGLSVCEDLWKGEDIGYSSRYMDHVDPVAELVEAGAEVIVNASASPFVLHKGIRHRELLAEHATRHGVFVASVNLVGGNDDLVFDGHSAVIAPDGSLVAAANGFEENLLVYDIQPAKPGENRVFAKVADPLLETKESSLLYRTLKLGIRDYVSKTGFDKVVIGLSGGIDSAVTATIAVGALGPEAVVGVTMPGKYSSPDSREDAKRLAERLGIVLLEVPIEAPFQGACTALAPAFKQLGEAAIGSKLPDVAEENLQSRMRGTVLMAFANRLNALALTTGNKSELAVGYCTLYGDMNGGLSPLGDLVKSKVYHLAWWLNDDHAEAGFSGPPIPERSIEKPPSAELAPNQLDSDTLPDYELLDYVIAQYVEQRQSAQHIADESTLGLELVKKLVAMIDRAEHKRYQTPVVLKVTPVAFGPGRRRPLAQRFRVPAQVPVR